MSKTKVALLGAGFIADIHLESYHRFVPDAEVVAVYTRNPQTRAGLRQSSMASRGCSATSNEPSRNRAATWWMSACRISLHHRAVTRRREGRQTRHHREAALR